jgi:hypothetical protein
MSSGETMLDCARDACDACFDTHKDDCSGFVRTVGATTGLTITYLINDVVSMRHSGGLWIALADLFARSSATLGHQTGQQ